MKTGWKQVGHTLRARCALQVACTIEVADATYGLTQILARERKLRAGMEKRSAQAEFAMRYTQASDVRPQVHMTLIRSTIEQMATKAQSTSANDDTKIEHNITAKMPTGQDTTAAFCAKSSPEATSVKMTSGSNEAFSRTECVAKNTLDLNIESSFKTTSSFSAPFLLHTSVANTFKIRDQDSDCVDNTFSHREMFSATTTSYTSSAAGSTYTDIAKNEKSSSTAFECDANDKSEISDWTSDELEELCQLPMLNCAGDDSEMQITVQSVDGNTAFSVEHTKQNSEELADQIRPVLTSCSTFFQLTSPKYQADQVMFGQLLWQHGKNEVNLTDLVHRLTSMFQSIDCAAAKQIVRELASIDRALAHSTSFSFTMLQEDSPDISFDENTASANTTPDKAEKSKKHGWQTPENLEHGDTIFGSPGFMAGMNSSFASAQFSPPLDRLISPPQDRQILSASFSPPQNRQTISASFSLQTPNSNFATASFKMQKTMAASSKKTDKCEFVNCKICGRVFKQSGIRKHMHACKKREVSDLHLPIKKKILCVCCRGFVEPDIFQEHYLQCSGQHPI